MSHLNADFTTHGLEFVEFATANPDELDQLLRQLHFTPIAKHRNKPVTLYRQGAINLILNASADSALFLNDQSGGSQIRALAVRVEDAGQSYANLLARGAWGVEATPGVMELNIPAIEMIGGTRLYLVDRYDEQLSIYDIDFRPLPKADAPPALFQRVAAFEISVLTEHAPQWRDFFCQLLNFTQDGAALVSPDGTLRLNLKLLDSETASLSNEGISGLALESRSAFPTGMSGGLQAKTTAASGECQITGYPSTVAIDIRVLQP